MGKTVYIRTHKTVYTVNYASLMLFDNYCVLLKLLHSLMKEKTLNQSKFFQIKFLIKHTHNICLIKETILVPNHKLK